MLPFWLQFISSTNDFCSFGDLLLDYNYIRQTSYKCEIWLFHKSLLCVFVAIKAANKIYRIDNCSVAVIPQLRTMWCYIAAAVATHEETHFPLERRLISQTKLEVNKFSIRIWIYTKICVYIYARVLNHLG